MRFTYRRDKRDPMLVRGNYGVYSFKAKLFDTPVKEGIANGRVIELRIYSGGQEIGYYERGWYSGQYLISLYKPIVERLERIKPKLFKVGEPR